MKLKRKFYNTLRQMTKTTMHNLWNAAKVVLRGKSIVIHSFLKNKKNLNQPTWITTLRNQGEKKRERKPKISQKKEIIKIWKKKYHTIFFFNMRKKNQ